MLRKTITYTDYDGNLRTENFWFNLTKTDLMEMQYMYREGLDEELKKFIIVNKNGEKTVDISKMLGFVKELIRRSYGEKSDDGKRFVKAPELYENFVQTPAYDVLMMELFSSEDAAMAFIMGIIPQDLASEVSTKISDEGITNFLDK